MYKSDVHAPADHERSNVLPVALPRRSAVSWRSVLIGTMGVAGIAALTPYNDFILDNTPLTASFFPPAITMCALLLVAFNTLLRAIAPARSLTGGEMAVVVAMLLTCCAVPGIGFMRIVIPMCVTFFYQGQSNAQLWSAFTSLDLPSWLFAVPDMESGRSSDIVNAFFSRVPPGEPIPWGAWVRPMVAWGAFFACVSMALLSLTPILRHQWAVNERLAFPLAQVGTMLIEPPAPGRKLNRLLRSPSFWITAGFVFMLHSLAALNVYFPRNFPPVPLTYNLTATLSDGIFKDLSAHLKTSTIYFTVIGITYFIPARVAFGLWSIVLIELFTANFIVSLGGDVPNGVWDDQHLGACGAVLLGILWVGRHHWWSVTKQAFGGKPTAAHEPHFAGWARAFLVAIAGMFVWLSVVGVGPIFTTMIIVVVLSVHILLARVVMETGIPFLRIQPTVPQIMTITAPQLLTGKEMFFSSTSTYFGALATREGLLPHALHGLQISQSVEDNAPRPRSIIVVMAWALMVAFVVSAISSLWCYYTYASPIGGNASGLENPQGIIEFQNRFIGDNITNHAANRYPSQSYNSAVQIGLGAAITGVLQVCVLRLPGWPFMPVAYLASHVWYIRMLWWSIFLGWLCKVLILRFGGATLYQQLKTIFVAFVVGEAIAAGFWLAIALILVALGEPFQVISILPR